MSEMKIPRDSLSVHSEISPADGLQDTSSTPASSLDSLETISISDQILLSAKKKSDAPQLTEPDVYVDSMLSYFQAISGAKIAFKQQLAASDKTDQTMRLKSVLNATGQAQQLQQLIDQRAEAVKQAEKEAKLAMDELQKKLKEMENDTQEQQKLIDKINQGNDLEQKNSQDFAKAYTHYLNQLKNIGAVDNGNGSYDVPAEARDEFEAITREYNKAENKYNSYRQGREAEINAYNKATLSYNQRAEENNQALQEIVNTYQLSDYLKAKGISLPKQELAELSYLSKKSDVSHLPTIPFLDGQVVSEGIYQSLYQLRIVEMDRQIASIILYWQFTQKQTLNTIPDPLLNTKPLSQRILPEASTTAVKKTIPESTSEGMIPMQAVGIDSAQMATMLGRNILKEVIDSLKLKISKGKEENLKENLKEQITDKLLLFSVGMLGSQSVHSLFPSVSPIAQSLSSLPADSPVFSILFAISFANRIQENSNLGMNKAALLEFVKEIPELEGTSEEDLAKLEAALTLGQLAITLKLLETSLGLPGLTAQLLIPFSGLNSENVKLETTEEQKQELQKMGAQIEENFILEGFPKEESHFLSQLGIELSEQGTLTPAAASISTPDSIQKPLLIDSVKAALVLSKTPLQRADTLAREAVENTLAETPYSSAKQLRSSLEIHLQELGVRDKAPEIALQAIVIPPKEKTLLSTASLPPAQLTTVLEKRALELLGPQLGIENGTKVAKELVKSLFGDILPSTLTIADVKSPYSVVNVIQNQLYKLRLEQNKKWTDSVSENFKETIKSMENFSSFALKLMNPAYLFVYSGIIYANQGRKKPLDIMI